MASDGGVAMRKHLIATLDVVVGLCTEAISPPKELEAMFDRWRGRAEPH
jgi:hypothetical protein